MELGSGTLIRDTKVGGFFEACILDCISTTVERISLYDTRPCICCPLPQVVYKAISDHVPLVLELQEPDGGPPNYSKTFRWVATCAEFRFLVEKRHTDHCKQKKIADPFFAPLILYNETDNDAYKGRRNAELQDDEAAFESRRNAFNS